MYAYRLTWLYLALVLLCGCSSLGLAPAQSFEEKLAYAYGTHTAVLQAATTSLNSGALSREDAAYILKASDQARSLLDSAKALESSGDSTGANSKLALATAALTALQSYLSKHNGGA